MLLRWSGDFDSVGAEKKRKGERDEMSTEASSAEPWRAAASSTLLRLLLLPS